MKKGSNIAYSIKSGNNSAKGILNHLELSHIILTYIIRFVKQDLIHLNTVPSTLILESIKKNVRSIVSIAAERSTKVRTIVLPESFEAAISFWILRSAVSVECNLL